jgi:hypothetical protein
MGSSMILFDLAVCLPDPCQANARSMGSSMILFDLAVCLPDPCQTNARIHQIVDPCNREAERPTTSKAVPR